MWHYKFYKSRIPSQYFTLHSFILSATLSPRSPGPSGSPPPTRSGPEPLWIHPRPTRPRGTSQPPVHAAGAGKPRPTVICCEVADKNQYNKLLGIVNITVEEFGTDHTHTVKYLILRMSECQVVYLREPVGPGLLNRDSHNSK